MKRTRMLCCMNHRLPEREKGRKKMISYLIVGSGYRSEYFGRVAAAYPGLFRAMYLCRSPEKAALITAHTGLPATDREEEALAFRPDFAVIAVDRGHMAEVAETWIRKGFAVLTETPVGCTEEELQRLLALEKENARIVCCEQYFRQPLLAQGLRAIEEGKIGTPSSLYISLLHDYHAASLIRKALRIQPEEEYTVCGLARKEPVVETDSRAGAILDGRVAEGERMTAIISFASGKQAVYDFCPVQYRSYLRSRHLVVRGDRGEWSDTVVSWLDGENLPRKLFLMPEIPEAYRCLDTQALRDRRRNWQDELAPDTVQDEFAIATLLLDMGAHVRGAASPYPLAEAVADARFWLALQEAAKANC